MIQEGDIIFTHSGGNDNTDPTKDLGGDPSSHVLTTGINNLFADVTEEQSVSGYTDYRCFYIFNNNEADSLFNTRIWLESKTPTSSTQVSLGLNVSNDIQQLTITGDITGGNLIIVFDGIASQWNWMASVTNWAISLQNILNNTAGLSNVVVTVAQQVGTPTITTFTINFTGNDGARFQPLLLVSQNNLIGVINISVAKIQDGGPINGIAPVIDQATTPPFGILFSTPNKIQPQPLGVLRPTDGIPVWVRRTVLPNSKASTDDGAIIHFTGNPF